jgi:hypothetical protein
MRFAHWTQRVVLMGLLLGASRPAAAAIPQLAPLIWFHPDDNATNHPSLGNSVALDADTGLSSRF